MLLLVLSAVGFIVESKEETMGDEFVCDFSAEVDEEEEDSTDLGGSEVNLKPSSELIDSSVFRKFGI